MDGYFFLLFGLLLSKEYFNIAPSIELLLMKKGTYACILHTKKRMQIIETFIASKYGDDALCEDGLFINDKFIAVMDGVTAKGDILWNNKTSGFHAKETLLNAMEQLNGSENAVQAFEYLNSQLHKQYDGNDDFSLKIQRREYGLPL